MSCLLLQNRQMARSPPAGSPVNMNPRANLRVVIPSSRPMDSVPVSEDQVSQSELLPHFFIFLAISAPKYQKLKKKKKNKGRKCNYTESRLKWLFSVIFRPQRNK